MDYEELANLSKRRMNVSLSLPMKLVEVIDRIAEHDSTTASRVFERALRKGLLVERDEREKGAK